MKISSISAVILLLTACGTAQEDLYLFSEGQNKGFMNSDGTIVIPAVYKQATPFSQGKSAVRIGNLMGYIDSKGATVIEPQWAMAGSFSEGLAPVMIEGKIGFINESGTLVIPPQYQSFQPFLNGFSVISKTDENSGKELFGAIDQQGKEVLKPIYSILKQGSHGLFLSVLEEKARFIDSTGKPINEEEYVVAFPHQEGLALVSKGLGDLRFINTEGITVIDLVKDVKVPEGSQIYISLGFSEGLSVTGVATQDGVFLYGAINTDGQWIVQPTYAGLGSFKSGLAPVLVQGLYGYINKDEITVIPPSFENAENFYGEIAKVVISGKKALVNKKGSVVKYED